MMRFSLHRRQSNHRCSNSENIETSYNVNRNSLGGTAVAAPSTGIKGGYRCESSERTQKKKNVSGKKT